MTGTHSGRHSVVSRNGKDTARMQLLPGRPLSTPEQGFFRLCFTAFDEAVIREAIRRISRAPARRPP